MEFTDPLDNDNKPVQFLDGECFIKSLVENQCCKIEEINNTTYPLVLLKKLDIVEGQYVNLKTEQDVSCKLEHNIPSSDFDHEFTKILNKYNINKEEEKILCLKTLDIDSAGKFNGNIRRSERIRKRRTTRSYSNEEFEVDVHDSDTESRNLQEIQYNCAQSNTITGLITAKKKYVKPLKFVCNYCGKKFGQSNILRQHVRIHTGQKPHKCRFCRKPYRTKTLLQLHYQDHAGLRYSCNVCKKGFKTLSNLKVHSVVHGDKPYHCNHCGIPFSQKSGFHRHMLKKHIQSNPPTVGDAVKHVVNVDNSNRVQTKSLEKAYKCSDCGKWFRKRCNLVNHTYIHLNIKKFSCDICDLKFVKSSAMEYHKKIHEKKYEFVCYECNLSFNQKFALKNHIANKHLKIKSYACKLCKAEFTNSSNLNTHIDIHHNNDKKKKFICNICNMGFNRSTYLYRHSKIHSDSNKQFTCDVCGYTCRTKTDIRRHVLTHFGGGDKPFKCEECGKAFSKPSHYLRHQLVHSDKRPYKCLDCDNAYKDIESLKTHRKAHHSGVTFTCKTCGFHSINEHSFRRHLRSC